MQAGDGLGQHSADESTDEGAAATASKDPVVRVPIGTHTVNVSAGITAYLESSGQHGPPPLDATRVWIERTKSGLSVHLGDVDVSTMGD